MQEFGDPVTEVGSTRSPAISAVVKRRSHEKVRFNGLRKVQSTMSAYF